MEFDYKGFEISLDIQSTQTSWIVCADVKKLKDGVVVEKFPRLKETFPLSAGGLNCGLLMQKIVENKIDEQLITSL